MVACADAPDPDVVTVNVAARQTACCPRVMLSKLALYCTTKVAAVTPLPLLSEIGMPFVVLLGSSMVSTLSGPRAKSGMLATTAVFAATVNVVV